VIAAQPVRTAGRTRPLTDDGGADLIAAGRLWGRSHGAVHRVDLMRGRQGEAER